MKVYFAILLAVYGTGVLAWAENPPPIVKVDGSISTGVNCFVPLMDSSQEAELYAFDNPLGGMDAPYQVILGGRMTAPGYGLSIHLSTGYNSMPAGSNQQNSFQLWDGYAWCTIGMFTLEAGQLDEFDFVSWVDRQSYLARDKFGSAGVALKCRSGGLQAIVEVPAYIPGAASNQNFRWNSSGDPGPGGIDGSALSAFKSLYAAASYSIPKYAAFQIGYQGQGSSEAGHDNGANLWADFSFKGMDRLIAYLELELWNVGQCHDQYGEAVDGIAYTASALAGWNFEAFTLQNAFVFLEGDTSADHYFDFRLQPSISRPLSGSLNAVLTARIDNLAGGTFLSSQGAGKASFWINPELRLALGGNQIAFGFYIGNDYTGGDAAGGSWFFGNTAASTPGFDRRKGEYTVSVPKAFIDSYLSLVFGF
jgi:hypothetical protein